MAHNSARRTIPASDLRRPRQPRPLPRRQRTRSAVVLAELQASR